MNNTKYFSIVLSLAVLAACFGHMAYELLGYHPTEAVVINNDETVVLAKFEITSDRPIEIRSMTLHVDSDEGLPELSSVVIRCDTCRTPPTPL